VVHGHGHTLAGTARVPPPGFDQSPLLRVEVAGVGSWALALALAWLPGAGVAWLPGCLALAWFAPSGAFGDPDGSNNLVASGWLVNSKRSFGRDHSPMALL
jgi:hypothetical protein